MRMSHAGKAARELGALASRVRSFAPRTVAGVIVWARALAAYTARPATMAAAGKGKPAPILGQSLANAVLRAASVGV
jgi:hypothetical protein